MICSEFVEELRAAYDRDAAARVERVVGSPTALNDAARVSALKAV